jgi:hypothetical protein
MTIACLLWPGRKPLKKDSNRDDDVETAIFGRLKAIIEIR